MSTQKTGDPEKLGLLPIVVINHLRAGKVESAIQYSEEYLRLNGGMSSLKKGLERPGEEKFAQSAILPAVNCLSLKFMQLKELEPPSTALISELEAVVANYRLCLQIAKRYQEPSVVQEAIGDNFFNVTQAMREQDALLLNIDMVQKKLVVNQK